MFADTPKGAKANAVLYTLVESARANELNVYQYLDYLLTELPDEIRMNQKIENVFKHKAYRNCITTDDNVLYTLF